MTAFLSSQLKQISKRTLYSSCISNNLVKIIETSPSVSFHSTTATTSSRTFTQSSKANNNIKRRMSPPSSSHFHLPFSTTSTSSESSSSSSGLEILDSFNDGKKFEFEGNDIPGAMYALANADAVCFDVDSTVIQEEGIDVLAASLGKGQEVADFTAKAMGGSMKFEDALAARLELMKPSKSSIMECLEEHPIRLSPGVDRLIESLHRHGTDVFFVSGGFRIMIEPIAKELMVAKTNIYANTILFDEADGNTYKGFDATEPTSADGGKTKALSLIKEKYGYNIMVMVGDGATDAQAKPPADSFIGFGGVVVRDAVKEKACWFVNDFQDIISIVEKNGDKNKRAV